ncbi:MULTISPECIES: DUF2735 domain-containing protein [Alphaproteobacteria]|uniref:DUF2735 domain-containing protein n=2 Tax=Alphaproteobacteria TaxID=28211 RepID=A0A512HF39_9HYPH|nr:MULTISPECIES: DUF2735 domain-containing protein [Alphaproteobacteria]GEO84051.1 hypothetical protein RNA01_09830 [Ciceribacter naphthalenivorans]GLR21071.1 hypothetical protein GCM10007920_08570 [Ciceribacter naphthalenivorans]GLT03927.1 hypothetical protein GCM10007926_08570 [Sphingomonas psychrolutea]
MTTNMVRESAKILEFPVRNIQKLREMQQRERPVIIESGCGSWYHQEAIREAEEAPKQ